LISSDAVTALLRAMQQTAAASAAELAAFERQRAAACPPSPLETENVTATPDAAHGSSYSIVASGLRRSRSAQRVGGRDAPASYTPDAGDGDRR